MSASVCAMESETGLCAGCLRTLDEIAAWPVVTDEARLAILQALKARRRARGQTSPADSRPRRRARV
jgi:uncharacterized protein